MPGGSRSEVTGSEAGQSAHDTIRGDPKHDEQEAAEDEEAVFREAGEQFGQDADQDRAEERPEDGARAPDHHGEQEQNGLRERERPGADEHQKRSEHRPREPGQHRRQAEGERPHGDRRDADRPRGILGIPQRDHGAPRPRPFEEREAEKRDAAQGGCEPDHLPVGEHGPSERRRHDARQAVRAPGQPLPLDEAVLDDEREGDRHHRQIRAPSPQGRDCQHGAERAREQAREGPCEPEAPAGQHGDGSPIGPDRVEGDMSERDQSREAKQNVEPDAHRRGQQHEGDDQQRVAVGGHGREGGGQADEHEGDRRLDAVARPGGGTHAQTLRRRAAPNSPLGLSASDRMTAAKTTICVEDDPIRPVASDSARP